MAYVVRADWRAAEGSESEVLAAIRQLTGPSRQEPGNLCFHAYRDPSEPRVFRLFEIYEDEAAFQAHLASDHFKEFGLGKALPLLEDRAIAFYCSTKQSNSSGGDRGNSSALRSGNSATQPGPDVLG